MTLYYLTLVLVLGKALADNAGSSYSSNCGNISMVNGCVATFGLDFGCPYSRYAEVSMKVGSKVNSNSDNVSLKISFLDSSNHRLGEFNIAGYGCNWHQLEHTDSLKVCAGWVPRVSKVLLQAGASDGLGLSYLHVTVGNQDAFKKNFWLDKPLQPPGDYQGDPAYDSLIIPV